MSSKKYSALKNLALLSQLGFSMALPIFAGVYLGSKLDDYLGTAPLFLIIFLILFTSTSFMSLFKLAGVKSTKVKKEKSKKLRTVEEKKSFNENTGK